MVNHLKKASGEIWLKLCEKNNKTTIKKTTKMRTKVRNKKLILRLRKHTSKGFPIKTTSSRVYLRVILHEYTCLIHKPRSREDYLILLYMVIVNLIQFALHLVQIPDFIIGKCPYQQHSRASSMLYGWCETGGWCSFTNSSPYIDPPIWSKDFELWFVRPKGFISLPYCLVFVCLGSLGPFDIALLPQKCFL